MRIPDLQIPEDVDRAVYDAMIAADDRKDHPVNNAVRLARVAQEIRDEAVAALFRVPAVKGEVTS